MGKVIAIFVSPDKGEPMVVQGTVTAEAGKGLQGDRYALGTGAYSNSKRQVVRHVSLISIEAIRAANNEYGTNFIAAETRRNIVVAEVNLNVLVDKEFWVGGVKMRGVELCDPCDRPSVLSAKPNFGKAFEFRGGLRAEILSSGPITVGDEVKTE